MKCPICGSVNNEGAAFCANCGSALKSETSGYMDSIDTSNLNNNNGFGKRNTQSLTSSRSISRVLSRKTTHITILVSSSSTTVLRLMPRRLTFRKSRAERLYCL